MTHKLATCLLATLLVPAIASPSFADWDRDRDGGGRGRIQATPPLSPSFSPHRGESNFRDHDHDRDHDRDDWHREQWRHARHERDGWWWGNGLWHAFGPRAYSYSYAYPPVPRVAAAPIYLEATSANAGYAWYCARPRGYAPYIAQCFVPWQAIPVE